MDRKDFTIIVLIVVILSLFYFIILGLFCHCGSVRCPNYCESPIRSHLA